MEYDSMILKTHFISLWGVSKMMTSSLPQIFLQGEKTQEWHYAHLPWPVKSSGQNRSIKHFPRWWQTTKYLEGNSSEFLSDRLVDVGASSCQAEDGRLPRLPCVPPPASHPHKPESHQESHSCARCKYIGPCMVPVIAVVYFCLPVIWKVKVRRQQLTYMFK